MRNHLPLIVALLLILLLLASYISRNSEGFLSDAEIHANFVDSQAKTYSPLGMALIARNNEGALGNNVDGLLHTIGSKKKYPLNNGKTGLFAAIAKCEAVTTNDCSAFNDPDFSAKCGVCLDIGENSKRVASTGGLVLLPDDRKSARDSRKGNAIPDYKATVGSCPANRLVSSKAECLSMKRKIECEKSGSYDLKECSQCYSDQSYTIVDSDPKSGVISGTGTLYVAGSGRLQYTETGYSSSKSPIVLSSTPKAITLQGPETTRVTLNILPSADDGPMYVSGYLSGKTATGEFTMDIFRIVLTDTVTGRKPRSTGSSSLKGTTVTTMAPGFGKTQMILILPMPFTFVDPGTEQASLCKDTPFITKQASAEFLNSDPCYKKGSGPGTFSLECLQGAYLSNGCVEGGKGFPKDATTSSALMTKADGSYRSLNDIAAFVYANAIGSSTGVGANGAKLSILEWSKASEFCTGKIIRSPCDTDAKASGPLSTDCLSYLWNNGGGKKDAAGKVDPTLATYSIGSLASSLFPTDTAPRFCQASGSLSPIDSNGVVNKKSVDFWKTQGGVEAVKKKMANIHTMANSVGLKDSERLPYLTQCYGMTKLAPAVEGPVFPAEPTQATSYLPTSLVPLQGRILGSNVDIYENYRIIFAVTPKSINHSNWSSILQFSNSIHDGFNPGNRSPGIWFYPGSLQLHIRIGDSKDGNYGIDPLGCALNKRSVLIIECNGKNITIVLDGKVTRAIQPTHRFSGKGFAFSGHPGYQAANCHIEDLSYTKL